jgi:hypothetical protein
LLATAAVAALIVLLLIAATAASLLLKTAASSARHCHTTGESAHEGLHVGAADETFAAAADSKSLGRVGQPHAGKSALPGRAATPEIALQAADTATGRSVSEHAARPTACSACSQAAAAPAAA